MVRAHELGCPVNTKTSTKEAGAHNYYHKRWVVPADDRNGAAIAAGTSRILQ